MKVINDSGIGKGVIFRVGGQLVCGLCRKEVEVSQECEHCSNSFKDGIVDVDHANRITDSFFNLLFPMEEKVYDKSSDYRPKVLHVNRFYDIIKSCEKAKQRDKMHMKERLLSEANIPKRYCFLSWPDFHTSLDLTELKQICLDRPDGEIIYLHGDNNTGKTLLMSIILQEFFDNSCSIFFITPERIADLYAKHWYDSGEKGSDLERVRELDVVGVDDLFDPKKAFIGKNGGLIIPSVDSFLRYRIHNKLTTIVTTNFSLSQIGQTDFHQTGKLLERGSEKFRILLT